MPRIHAANAEAMPGGSALDRLGWGALLSPRDQYDRRRWEDAKLTVSAALSLAWGKRMSPLDTGHLASVPGFAKEGESVCVFAGAALPYVLRPTRHSGRSGSPTAAAKADGENDRFLLQQHELVGSCYVEGVMYGELEAKSLFKEHIALR
jgi:hypothetical protein